MRHCFWILSLLLISCGSSTREAALTSDTTSSDGTTSTSSSMFDLNFYQRYTGTIAGKKVTAHLNVAGEKLSGTYYYDEIGIPIRLWPGGYDEVADRHKAFELAGDQSQSWSVTIDEVTVKGRWESTDREFVIDLKESSGSKLSNWFRADSIKARPTLAEPRGLIALNLMLPPRVSDAFDKAVLQVIPSGHLLGERDDRPAPRDLDGLWQMKRELFFKTYIGIVSEMSDSELVNSHSAMSFEESYNSEVFYDNDGMLVIGIMSYTYTGGAHGNGGLQFINYDQRLNKALSLADMMKVDSGGLKQILEHKAREYFSIPLSAPLNDRLFVDEMFVPPNYFITHMGITFSYWPYALASYAEGEIQLFVTWPEVHHLLRPEFITRMKL